MTRLLEFTTRHPLLVGALIAAWLAVMFYELRLRTRSLTHVTAADAVRLINKGAVVIDVRKPGEFEAGHIVNARNVALEDLQRDQNAAHKNKSKILLTVCDNGTASGRAATLLRKAGFEHVFSLKGGLSGWRAENLPLVK